MSEAPTHDDVGRQPTWIIGSDGSDGALHAAHWAAAHVDGRAELLRVATAWSVPAAPAIPPVGPMTRYWDLQSFEAVANESATSLANELRERADVIVDTVVTKGHASSALVREAKDAQLLVIGSRGRGGFARLILGSTSTQCATHADVPTAVIPPESSIEKVTDIVVAFDGSQNSLDAFRWALDFAAPGSKVTCIEVWEPIVVPAGADQFVFVDAMEGTRERFDEQTAAILADAEPDARGIDVELRFVEGRTRHTLAEAAEAADLLVMGARGHGAVSAALLGSVSTWLLHHVKQPMVIIPHRDADGADGADDEANDEGANHDV